ncbi:hypothetical protein GALMADRAFT_206012 [Galerina marginata CBS 339.88]|uniref:Uncharacterized protein n=1 Tax=Galerina marginata (strain CBS 339.88) TaxID=685588 RepID=A0A067TMF5_GALM3|nr:hypothetical protein GALMADRAFT_206012 [Galerina marginata CBS 339.88]
MSRKEWHIRNRMEMRIKILDVVFKKIRKGKGRPRQGHALAYQWSRRILRTAATIPEARISPRGSFEDPRFGKGHTEHFAEGIRTSTSNLVKKKSESKAKQGRGTRLTNGVRSRKRRETRPNNRDKSCPEIIPSKEVYISAEDPYRHEDIPMWDAEIIYADVAASKLSAEVKMIRGVMRHGDSEGMLQTARNREHNLLSS